MREVGVVIVFCVILDNRCMWILLISKYEKVKNYVVLDGEVEKDVKYNLHDLYRHVLPI